VPFKIGGSSANETVKLSPVRRTLNFFCWHMSPPQSTKRSSLPSVEASDSSASTMPVTVKSSERCALNQLIAASTSGCSASGIESLTLANVAPDGVYVAKGSH